MKGCGSLHTVTIQNLLKMLTKNHYCTCGILQAAIIKNQGNKVKGEALKCVPLFFFFSIFPERDDAP